MADTNFIKSVGFQSPGYDYAAELGDIERRRAFAQALQQQSMQPLEAPPTPAGGFAVPISPWQGVAKLAQGAAAGYGQHKATEMQKELAKRIQSDQATDYEKIAKIMQGVPEQPGVKSVAFEGGVGPEQHATPGRSLNMGDVGQVKTPQVQAMIRALLMKQMEEQNKSHVVGPDATLVRPGMQNFTAPGRTPQPTMHNFGDYSQAVVGGVPNGPKIPFNRPITPQQPSNLARLQAERAALPAGDPRIPQYDNAIRKESETARQISPATHINMPQPPVAVMTKDGKGVEFVSRETAIAERRTPATQDPNQVGRLAGAKMETKRQFNMQGIGATIAEAEDLLTNKAKPPTGSLIGTGVDIAGSVIGKSPSGAVEAQKLKAIGGALVAKMPRMEGPQSDRDVALYKEMSGMVGDSTVPIDRRVAALEEVKKLWTKYERLNPQAFQAPAASGLSPSEQQELQQLRQRFGR